MKDKRTIFNTTVEENVRLLDEARAKQANTAHMKLLSKKCEGCDKVFQQNRSWQSFCSSQCKSSFHQKERSQMLSVALFELDKANRIIEHLVTMLKLNAEEIKELKDRL